MAVAPIQRANPPLVEPTFLDDLGDYAARITNFVSNLINTSFNPQDYTSFYLFPSYGAYWTNCTRANETDPTQEAHLPLSSRRVALEEINRLARFANVGRQVILYTRPLSPFSSYGGYCSISSPALIAPQEHIFRMGVSSFGSEMPQENLSASPWHFSDHEVRYLVTRELGRMRYNVGPLLDVAKVILFATTAVFCFTSITLIAQVAIVSTACLTYLAISHEVEYFLDRFSIKTVAQALNTNEQQIKTIAIAALEKTRQQNLERRNRDYLDYLSYSSSGNDITRYWEPLLTSRIRRLHAFQ